MSERRDEIGEREGRGRDGEGGGEREGGREGGSEAGRQGGREAGRQAWYRIVRAEK